MYTLTRPLIVALILGCAAPPLLLAQGSAFAMDAEAAQAQQAPKQIELTEKEITGVIAAKGEIDAILEKLPEGAEQPDAKTLARLDAAAKKHGFADYAEYDLVITNITLVLDGVDPQTKKYVGQDMLLKQQIAEIQGDKTMSATEKKNALDQLDEAAKAVTPLQFPGNAALVTKHYDQLGPLMSQDD
jgi:hypothetical protein